jgi:Domain of unknown function (DUF4234)
VEVIESKISGLKSQVGEGTLKMVLLGIVTFGIYKVIWLLERYKIFNEMSGREAIGKSFILVMPVMMGLGHLLMLIAIGAGTYNGSSSSIFDFVWMIMIIVASFRISKIMEFFYLQKFGLDLKFNPVYLVLFDVYYINYCINELEEIEQKENIKKARS